MKPSRMLRAGRGLHALGAEQVLDRRAARPPAARPRRVGEPRVGRRAAISSAVSGVSVMKAFRRGFSASIASTCARGQLDGAEIALRPARPCAPARVRSVRLHHSTTFGTAKKPPSRSGALASTFVRHRRHRSPRRRAAAARRCARARRRPSARRRRCRPRLQLLDPAEDAVELARHGRAPPRAPRCGRGARRAPRWPCRSHMAPSSSGGRPGAGVCRPGTRRCQIGRPLQPTRAPGDVRTPSPRLDRCPFSTRNSRSGAARGGRA